MIEIEGPDGRIYEFPDGTSRETMRAAMQKRFGAKRGQSRGWVDEAAGALANINRGLVVGDEMAAGFRAVTDIATGKADIRRPIQAYRNAMLQQRGLEDDFATRRPLVASAMRGTGSAATFAVPAAPVVNSTRAANAARAGVAAATTATASAAADRGSARERLAAASQTAMNPMMYGMGAAFGAAARPAVAPRPRPATPQSRLQAAGVALTPGQKAAGRGPVGDLVKNAEDLAQRAPILGPAISGARQRANESLNRSVALQAVAPIGGTIPKSVKPGFEMVEAVDDQIGRVYDEAADMVTAARVDDDLTQDLVRIAERKADLSETSARQFDSIVRDRLTRLSRPDLTGRHIKDIHSELGALQREATRKGEDTLSSMIGDVRLSLMGLLGRHSPEAQALVGRADEAWGIYSIMNDAAAAAQARGGRFTPGQLGTQARMAAKGQGSNMAGKGKGRLQQFAADAQEVMPDQFGNPGTANAIGLGGGVVGLATEPATTVAVGAGLAAAATPYMLMARRVVEQLPQNATAAQLQEAADQLAQIAARDPAAGALYRQVVARLNNAAAAGAAVSGASSQ